MRDKTKTNQYHGEVAYIYLKIKKLQDLEWWTNVRYIKGKDIDLELSQDGTLCECIDIYKLAYDKSKKDSDIDKPGNFE